MATEELLNTKYPNVSAPQTEQINAMYEAQKEANRLALENAYNQNMSDAQAAKDKIAPQYQTAANDLAVQYERNRRNFNTQAANSGINTGTASQARLAQSNEYLRDFGKLRSEESNAITEADRGITDLKTQYQNSVAAAAADYDYKKAAALLDEYNNQYARAQQLAQYGDFSLYANLYGQDVADNMLSVWKASNPDLAYNTGRMTAQEYRNITGKYPAGYSAPSSGGGYYYGGSSSGTSSGTGAVSSASATNKTSSGSYNPLASTGIVGSATSDSRGNPVVIDAVAGASPSLNPYVNSGQAGKDTVVLNNNGSVNYGATIGNLWNGTKEFLGQFFK